MKFFGFCLEICMVQAIWGGKKVAGGRVKMY